ncbi:MAG: glutathione S-transferase family protein [Steroidobacteraceae bacterium]
MLEVYHWEPNGASGRVLVALAEKRVDFASHYVDLLALEQYEPRFLELSATAEIPLLVLDGAVYGGASELCELLEEIFPQPPLMPAEPRGRWEVRTWQKLVDDGLAASVSELAWQRYGLHGTSAFAPPGLAAAGRIPLPEQREAWQAALGGYAESRLGEARERVEAAVRKVESSLARSRWLAGPSFSLADVAVFASFNYLPRLCSAVINDAAAPRTLAWLRAVAARPAVHGALARGRAADPYAVAAPGPEQIRWG